MPCQLVRDIIQAELEDRFVGRQFDLEEANKVIRKFAKLIKPRPQMAKVIAKNDGTLYVEWIYVK